MVIQTMLKRLNLGANDLSSVRPEHLGPALASMMELQLESTYLTDLQCSRLFSEMATKGKEGEVLNLRQNTLTNIPELSFSTVISRFTEVFMLQINQT